MQQEDMEELDNLIDVDQYALDKECTRQPRLFMNYALALAEAKENVATAKADFDLVKAEVKLEIRESPANYGLRKITEASVEEMLLTTSKYKKALKAYHKAKRAVDDLTAVVDAMEHRKKAIEGLIYLHGQNYFSTPREKTDHNEGRKVIEEINKKSARKPIKRGK